MQEMDVENRGSWLATSRGMGWSIHNPEVQDVYLQDILAGLSRACRYAGQIKLSIEMYSVSEHSSLMTRYALENGRVEALEDAIALHLHDASEFIYGDVTTPVKQEMPGYRTLEDKGQGVIQDAFGLTSSNTRITKPEIKELDLRIRIDERMALINEPALSASLRKIFNDPAGLKPLGVDIKGLGFRESMRFFLETMAICCETLPARDPCFAEKLKERVMDLRENGEIDFTAECDRILDAIRVEEHDFEITL